jgi:hypothetical protein
VNTLTASAVTVILITACALITYTMLAAFGVVGTECVYDSALGTRCS